MKSCWEILEARRLLCVDPTCVHTLADPADAPIAAADATALYPDLFPWISASHQFVHNWSIDTATIPGRTLLRLTYAGANLGSGPVEVRGGPVNQDGTQQVFQRIYNSDGTWVDHLAGSFIYHAAHDHIHFEEFAQYNIRALSSTGGVGAIVAGGEKTSFCLLDSIDYDDPPVPGAPPSAVYVNCDRVKQGISAGWSDIYTKSLDGQTIDITDLQAGTYWLEVEADPSNRFLESDETNNVGRIKIDIHPGDDGTGGAYNLGVLGPAQTYNEYVGANDLNDFYKFTLNNTTTVSLVLKDLYNNANLRLLSSTGALIEQSGNSGTLSETITRSLLAGTYYVHIVRSVGNTTYTLEMKDTAAAAPGTINGTAGNDTITLRRNPSNQSLVDVFFGGVTPAYSFNADHLLAGTAQVLSQGGDDTLILDFANSAPAPGGGLSFNGGAQGSAGDLLVLSGTSATETAIFTNTHFDLGGTSIVHSGAERFRFDGGAGGDTLNINSGSYRFASDASLTTANQTVNIAAGATSIFDSTQHLKSLSVAGMASVTSGAGATIVTDTLSITGTGKLDLRDNDLVAHQSALGSWNGSAYTGITGYVQSGRNDGAWNGNGLVTSMPAATGGPVITTLAVARAADALVIGASETALWNGESVTGSSILVKYTYMGDVDLNGHVDGDDYFYIDSNILLSGAVFGYSAGDIDFDGLIGGDDYFWLDSQIQSQGPPL